MTENTEPTNTQLANFLVIYASQIPGAEHLQLDAFVLEKILDSDPTYREDALKQHTRFQEQLNRLHDEMMQGKLQCEHIRSNGRRCPNFNETGSFYCGLHREDD